MTKEAAFASKIVSSLRVRHAFYRLLHETSPLPNMTEEEQKQYRLQHQVNVKIQFENNGDDMVIVATKPIQPSDRLFADNATVPPNRYATVLTNTMLSGGTAPAENVPILDVYVTLEDRRIYNPNAKKIAANAAAAGGAGNGGGGGQNAMALGQAIVGQMGGVIPPNVYPNPQLMIPIQPNEELLPANFDAEFADMEDIYPQVDNGVGDDAIDEENVVVVAPVAPVSAATGVQEVAVTPGGGGVLDSSSSSSSSSSDNDESSSGDELQRVPSRRRRWTRSGQNKRLQRYHTSNEDMDEDESEVSSLTRGLLSNQGLRRMTRSMTSHRRNSSRRRSSSRK
jgi:hypothetical protein